VTIITRMNAYQRIISNHIQIDNTCNLHVKFTAGIKKATVFQ